MKISIPNEEIAGFKYAACKVRLMREYGHCAPFDGLNEDGERIVLSVAPESILLETYQHNGWIRQNWFDENGCPAGETFSGRWYVPENPQSTKDAISEVRRLLHESYKNSIAAAAGYDEGYYTGEAEAYENVLEIFKKLERNGKNA